MSFKETFQLRCEPALLCNVITDTRRDNEYFSNLEGDMKQLWDNIDYYINNIIDKDKEDYNEKLTELKHEYLNKIRHERNLKEQHEREIKRLQQELIRPFPVNAEPLRAPYRLNLLDYFHSSKKPSKDLKDYLPSEVKYLSKKSIGEYNERSVKIIFRFQDYIFLYHNSFGSCSGCDDTCESNIYTETYIKRTLSDGNLLQFWDLNHARAYCQADSNDRWKEWTWDAVTREMFDEAEKNN